MHIAISGSHGLVGTALVKRFEADGHVVHRLVRGEARQSTDIPWDPAGGRLDPTALDAIDAVVNLGGVSIGGGLWTAHRKQLLWDSRIDGTQLLVSAMCEAADRPRTLVSTSAVGFYGDRGDEVLTEASAKGTGFLSDLSEAWESASQRASECSVRVVNPRFGVVLAREGGMLPLIRKPFQLGLGGPLGSGDQYMAWISLVDLVNILGMMILDDDYRGPVNVVSPEETTNAMFTKAMGAALRRPTVMRVPKAVLSALGGDLARELILASQRVRPETLLDRGYVFAVPGIADAVR